jgi:copper resistance protein B
MRSAHLAYLLLAATLPAIAQHAQHAEHAPPSPAAAASVSDADRAAAFPDLGTMRMADMHLEDPLNKLVLLDRLESQNASGGDVLAWNLEAWVGRDLGKLWIRSEGERQSGDTERAELELLYGRGFWRWWELVAGGRIDFAPAGDQSWAAVGVRGLTPYRFDVEATTYLGSGGRAALRLETTYELLVTNRWILEPLLELNWHGQTDTARAVGAGLSDGELGLRLRYEVRREIAPYFGLVRERSFGRTADLARAAGHDPDDTRLVAGVRLWF